MRRSRQRWPWRWSYAQPSRHRQSFDKLRRVAALDAAARISHDVAFALILLWIFLQYWLVGGMVRGKLLRHLGVRSFDWQWSYGASTATVRTPVEVTAAETQAAGI